MKKALTKLGSVALAIGMLLSIGPAIHAEEAPEVSVDPQGKTEESGFLINAYPHSQVTVIFSKDRNIQPNEEITVAVKVKFDDYVFKKEPVITFDQNVTIKDSKANSDKPNEYVYTLTGISANTNMSVDCKIESTNIMIKDPRILMTNSSVNGVVNRAVEPVTIQLFASFDRFNEQKKGTDLSSWITDLPEGLTAVCKDDVDAGAVTMIILISGTPKEAKEGTIQIIVPEDALQLGASVTSSPNQKALWGIKDTGLKPLEPNDDKNADSKPNTDTNNTGENTDTGKPELEVIEGGSSVYHPGSNEPLTLVCSGKLEDLEDIYVNGEQLDESNYTLKSGSTILTLKPDYLKTLAAGKYTVRFQYKDEFLDVSFTVEKNSTSATPTDTAQNQGAPNTADATSTGLLLVILMLSGAGVLGIAKRRKRES